MITVEAQKQTRRSFTRELNLSVVEWYYSNNKKTLQQQTSLKTTENK